MATIKQPIPSRAPLPDKAPIVRVERWRPSKRFVAWIRAFNVLGLSRSLQVERRTIQCWVRGDGAPREDNARAIVLLSKARPLGIGPLTLEDIFGTPADP